MGMKIDMTGIEELARDINPTSLADPAAMEQLLSQEYSSPRQRRPRRRHWNDSKHCSP